jgi:hypothetical protein
MKTYLHFSSYSRDLFLFKLLSVLKTLAKTVAINFYSNNCDIVNPNE